MKIKRIIYQLKEYLFYRSRAWYRRVRYQWFTPHKLLAIRSIPIHDYRDIDFLMLETIFQLVVNYVENEQYHRGMGIIKHNMKAVENVSKLKGARWAQAVLNNKRDKATVGLMSLEIEVFWKQNYEEDIDTPFSAVNEQNAKMAKRLMKIYTWYKFERPRRGDPFDAFDYPEKGYIDSEGNLTNEFISDKPNVDGTYSMNVITNEYKTYFDKVTELEDKWIEEDTKMLKEAVSIRRYLWT